MKDEIRELNDTFYKIFDDLNEARPTLYGEAYPVIGAQILNEYCTEYYLLKLKCQIEEAQEEYRILQKHKKLIPRKERRYLIFRKPNVIKKLIDEEIRQEAQEFFADLAKRLGIDMTTIEGGAESAQAAQENGENAEAEQTDGSARQSAEGAEGEPEQAAETLADKLMKEYRNKTKKKKTEKGAGNGNAGNGECT
ncbi:MAG: hypothetical protein OSJ39_03540 [Clostridia bacterium]|nr:hypothetical protein [Clostridia bacterium]